MLVLHLEFYKVAGDFFVTIVTVKLVTYGHILYICIYFRDGGWNEFSVEGLDKQEVIKTDIFV
jgi:hypothetical protein